jgi:aarF domain-containing kinase
MILIKISHFISLVLIAVLLDHGIYRELNEDFRLDYCQLWKALIMLDSRKVLDLGEKFGVGKYSKYFPVIFTGRTIER